MQIELTGRAVAMTQKLRTQAETGLTRVEKIIGRKSTAHVVLGATKHGKVAEVAVKAKLHDLYAQSEAAEIEMALHDALEKVEKQALKHKKRLSTMKRHPEKTAVGSVRLQTSDEALTAQPGVAAKMRGAGKVMPKKPVKKADSEATVELDMAVGFVSDLHVVRTQNGVAYRPMGIEEALKEAAGLERPLFVFRDLADQAFVLHRLHDGRVEVIEVP